MAKQDEFPVVFERLKSIMKTVEPVLRIHEDQEGLYSLLGPYMAQYKKALWFGKVELGKRYVSYHLMAVYMFPDLLDGISDDLRKRMQGKSCFNFSTVNEPLFAELSKLTQRSIERVQASGILG